MTSNAAVKPLLWVVVDAEVSTAAAFHGHYQVQMFPKGCAVSWVFGSSSHCISDRTGVSLAEAKQLAQKDFTETIQNELD